MRFFTPAGIESTFTSATTDKPALSGTADPLHGCNLHKKELNPDIGSAVNNDHADKLAKSRDENALSGLENSARAKRQADSAAAPTDEETGNLPCLSQ